MSDDWFDAYAAGDFLPGPGFPARWVDPVVVDLVNRAYRLGRTDGAQGSAELLRDNWWSGYSAAVADLCRPVAGPRQRERHLVSPGRQR